MPDIENIEDENCLQSPADKNQITSSLPDQAGNEEVVNENNSLEQAIESPELQTTNLPAGQAGSKLQTEEMEVHKHPHHVMHKKKWSEYLLEFFMIFFAVTLGFFAENIRENITDHTREKEYAHLLLIDLRNDSLFYAQRKERIARILPDFDSLFNMLTQSTPASNYSVLRKFLPLGYTFNLEVTPTTYNEMKSSGTLRYIEDPELRKELQDYYEVKIPKAQSFIETCNTFFNQYIIPYYVNNIRSQDWDFKKDSLITATPVFENRNKESDQHLANIMWSYGHYLEAYIRTKQDPAAEECKKLMELLKENII